MSGFHRKLVRVVEIDVDFCDRVYGSAPCTASLSLPGAPRKCYNTFTTCQDRDNFSSSPLTLRFAEPRVDLPAKPLSFPVLEAVSPVTATVNIAGTNERYSGLGRRGTISATLNDFPYGDTITDKYSTERQSGDAQLDEDGYSPDERGTFFAKLKSRWPTYGDRPMRYIEGYIDEDTGEFVTERTRHYVITDFKGPYRDGRVFIEGKDILSLADDKKALCPKPSRGQLEREVFRPGVVIDEAITKEIEIDGEIEIVLVAPEVIEDNIFDLIPEGIGNSEYPSEGWATINREVVYFTRAGDTITLTERGLFSTPISNHREKSSFQLSYRIDQVRLDDLIEDLLVNYGNVPESFIPNAKWETDVTRWASSLLLNTIICKPEGVTSLISDLAVLGASVWWDDVDQEVGLKINSPVFGEDIIDFNDDAHILDIEQKDNDEERLTQVHFYSVQTNPTASVKDKNNFDRVTVVLDTEAELPDSYKTPRIREIFCRWLNTGADSVLLVNALRLLSRFNTAPIEYKVMIDDKDNDISLVDVVRLNTRINQDVTGKSSPRLTQVKRKSNLDRHGWTEIELQDFFFAGKFGVIAPNDTPVYGDATDGQKEQFVFLIAESEDFFPDNEPPYQLI